MDKKEQLAFNIGYATGAVSTGIVVVCVIIVGLLLSKPACAQVPNWDSSPMNYKNSELNYNNSPMNYNNSPQNWNNNPMNYNSNNGVYDNSGNRRGYETISPEGTKNYFDNNGNRTGYTPYGR
jgi:hypothetical protein